MPSRVEQVVACLNFFAVAAVEAWRKQYAQPLVAFRASSSFERKIGAVAAWLRQGEREAASIPCQPFNKAGFRKVLKSLRSLTLVSDPEVFVPQLVHTCASHGVAVVFAPAPRGCPASGATRFIHSDKAILQLSLRYKTNDHLWFTFFHEAGHLVLHGKKLILENTEGLDPQHEEEANVFARDLLIPPEHVEELNSLGNSATAIQDFAVRLGIAPGIVVGRLQKEKHLPWSCLHELKVKYDWKVEEDGEGKDE